MTSRARSLALALALLLMLGSASTAIAQEDMGVVFEVSNEGRPMEIEVISGADGTRFNMKGGEQGDVSMVWRADGVMLMMMHAQQMYMEFTREMMERMRQMMAQMGRAPETVDDDVDVSEYSFEETGNTETINGMSAFEVVVRSPEGQESMLWMSTDTEVGLFEAMVRMMEPMREMAMPGMDNPMQRFNEYQSLARAQGLPDGRVIRVVDPNSGSEMTLKEIIEGPFDASMFSAPEGYEKQSMPMMRN